MDRVRFAVEPVPAEGGGGFQVLLLVNDVEMTKAGAGLGMDPYDVLVPDNKFLPVPGGRTFGVARCTCGVYGCGSTDLTVTSSDDVVRWEWSLEVPVDHAFSFARGEYLAEVERLAGDHSWETPERTAGRLVWAGLDAARLRADGLGLSWLGNAWDAPDHFRVCLDFDNAYQIFLRFPWGDDSPQDLALRVLATLHAPDAPSGWQASWHGIARAQRDVPPRIAGGTWTKERLFPR
jgi:hypothetical protein